MGRPQVSTVEMGKTNMKPLLFFTLVLLSLAPVTAGAAAEPDAGRRKTETQNPLIGAWKLVSLEEPGADGDVHKPDCAGMFVFTRDGQASVQVMYRNARVDSAYALGGYEASYGSYRVLDSSTFTFYIEGALARTLIGKQLKRAYEVSKNRLTVKSTDPKEHWKAVWERY